MNHLKLPQLSRAAGDVTMPGSKSLSNRVLLLAALSQGETRISNLLNSDDVRYMRSALQQLGVNCTTRKDNTECLITGVAGKLATGQQETLFLGNAGTAMRPLAAILCIGAGDFTLTGEPRMYERPIKDLIDAMQPLGIHADYLKTAGYPPLQIRAKGLQATDLVIDGSISSQFLTALLMALPLLGEAVTVRVKGELVSKPYIDITLQTMAKFGVNVDHDDYQAFAIAPGQAYHSPGRVWVEGDASSASYFLAAAAISGGPVRVKGVGSASIQGDAGFAHVLEKMGAQVRWGDHWVEVARGSRLQAVDMDMNHIPDAAMTLATTALFAEGTTWLRNIYNWRVKETDRLAAMTTELRKLGADVIEQRDAIGITPPAQITPAAIDTYNDHRMAMAFSLAAFASPDIVIKDPDCTRKTFPNYFDLFAQLTA